MVDYQDRTKVVPGSAIKAQDVRFLPDQVETRYGTVDTMKRQQPYTEVTGIDVLEVLGVINPGEVPIDFTLDGGLLQEIPPGTGSLVPLTPPFALPINARMQSTQAENSLFMAFGDGNRGLCPPLMLNGRTQQLGLIGQNPIGALWNQQRIYQIGDLVRSSDGRWWRCYQAATGTGSTTGPQWPQLNGFFDTGTFIRANVLDAPGGNSAWEEWTPNCTADVPSPDLVGSQPTVLHQVGSGALPTGKDIYVKLSFVTTQTGETARGPAWVESTQGANDRLVFNIGVLPATFGGVRLPRWLAEINLQPNLFYPIKLNVWVASVNTGSSAPADSAYHLFAAEQDLGAIIIVSAISGPTASPYAQGCTILSKDPLAPVQFLGQNGSRWMMVVRKDRNASLVAVDAQSPIPVSIRGEVLANIISISRDGSGNVEATVSDVTGFAAGQKIKVKNCTGDSSFDGSFSLLGVESTLAPQGILSWLDPASPGASNDSTGSILLPASAPPVAFLPPGGNADLQDIAAFTVVGGTQAGPFFYVSDALPEAPVSVNILSLEGQVTVEQAILSIIRFDGGYVQATVADITGFAPQQVITVAATPDRPGMEGDFTLDAVQPTSDTAGILYWTSPNTQNSGVELDNQGTITLVKGLIGAVTAIVSDASKLSAGQPVYLSGVSNPDFDGDTVLSSVLGNVVVFPSGAVGAATGGLMTVQQNLPTTAPANPQAISIISRDFAGNVSAMVEDTGGFAPGQLVQVELVPTASFNGLVRLTGVTVSDDGFSGVLSWRQPGLSAENDISGLGALSGSPDILINYDDVLLESEADNEVTDQLTMGPPPNVADVYFVPSLAKFVYAKGDDSLFRFSNTNDAANINQSVGSLSVDDNSSSLAVCVREVRTGEILGIKEDGGYAIQPSDLPPTEWPCPNRWHEHGPPCAAAVAKGKDFLIFASFSSKPGAYRYQNGELEFVSEEFQGSWDRVNKQALASIWSLVDEDQMEVQFGVPLDCNTSPSHILVCSYIAGWGNQEVLNRYGKLITTRNARRWSIRNIPARTGKVVKRTLQAPVPSLGSDWPFVSITRQGGFVVAIFASINNIPPVLVPGGLISIIVPNNPTFDGQFSVIWQTATPPALQWIQGVVAGPLAITSWMWAGGASGSGTATLIFAGSIPPGVGAGTWVYIQGTGTSLDGGGQFINSVTDNGDGTFSVVFTMTGVFSPDASSGTGGLGTLFNPPID